MAISRAVGRNENAPEGHIRHQIASLAVLVALIPLAPVKAGNITSDLQVFSSSETNASGRFYSLTFGPTSSGGFNSSGASEIASTAWYPDHFGMYVQTSMNSTASGQVGSETAYANTQESLLIPAQQGAAQGDPGVLHLSYHLHGTVNIGVGITLDSGGNDVSYGRVYYGWGFFAGDVGSSLNNLGVTQTSTWYGNNVTDTVDKIIDVPIPFEFGVPFYYLNEFRLEGGAGSTYAPSTGFAEGDFSHTGTLLGGTVFDQFNQPISNPIVISDSGLDYINVPEPAALSLLALGAPLIARRRRANSLRVTQ